MQQVILVVLRTVEHREACAECVARHLLESPDTNLVRRLTGGQVDHPPDQLIAALYKLNLPATLTLKLIHLEDQLQKQEDHDQHKNQLRSIMMGCKIQLG